MPRMRAIKANEQGPRAIPIRKPRLRAAQAPLPLAETLPSKFGVFKISVMKNAARIKITPMAGSTHEPTSPINRPIRLVTSPIRPIITKMPKLKQVESQKSRFVSIFLYPLKKPMISGMMARWQGLRKMLRIPQTNAVKKTIVGWHTTRHSTG